MPCLHTRDAYSGDTFDKYLPARNYSRGYLRKFRNNAMPTHPIAHENENQHKTKHSIMESSAPAVTSIIFQPFVSHESQCNRRREELL